MGLFELRRTTRMNCCCGWSEYRLNPNHPRVKAITALMEERDCRLQGHQWYWLAKNDDDDLQAPQRMAFPDRRVTMTLWCRPRRRRMKAAAILMGCYLQDRRYRLMMIDDDEAIVQMVGLHRSRQPSAVWEVATRTTVGLSSLLESQRHYYHGGGCSFLGFDDG